MKIKNISRINRSGKIFDNLVDESFGRAKLKLCSSDRRSDSRGTRKKEFTPEIYVKEDFLSNLPELIKPETAASTLGISIKTIYDWRYRYQQRKIPPGLFVKVNRSLLIRTSILREWIASQNSSLRCERK